MSRSQDKNSGGILIAIKKLLESNRLGELLVSKGVLTQGELRYALARQRTYNEQLGRVLVHQNLVSRQELYKTLAQQWTLRSLAGLVTILIALSGVGIKSARAGTIKDIPAEINLVVAANAAFAPVATYPALFGSEEKRSGNLSAFTKWSGMFDRFEAAMQQPQSRKVMENLQTRLSGLEHLPLDQMAKRVNSIINETDYIVDQRNWGQSDYWETPVEFFSRGGDCEDFAIAKYVSLRALGVPEERLRVSIVHDREKNIPHAVLVVYTDSEALILDNQTEQVRSSGDIARYKPIFSINRHAWWLHTVTTGKTIVASAE